MILFTPYADHSFFHVNDFEIPTRDTLSEVHVHSVLYVGIRALFNISRRIDITMTMVQEIRTPKLKQFKLLAAE